MKSKSRNWFIVALCSMNAALVAVTQQNMLPASWQQYVGLASLVVAVCMKEFGSE